MSNFKKTQLESYQNRLILYQKAEETILSGQEYSIGNRSLKRADLSTVRDTIHYLEQKIQELEAAINGRGRRTFSVIPRDL